jgi:hypothetical protein
LPRGTAWSSLIFAACGLACATRQAASGKNRFVSTEESGRDFRAVFGGLDLEYAIQVSDFENLAQKRIGVRQDKATTLAAELLVKGKELAQRGAGEVVHIAQIEQQLLSAGLASQLPELLTGGMSVFFGETAIRRE